MNGTLTGELDWYLLNYEPHKGFKTLCETSIIL